MSEDTTISYMGIICSL